MGCSTNLQNITSVWFGLSLAIAAQFLWAFTNIIDNLLSNKVYRNIGLLLGVSTVLNILFVPALAYDGIPAFPPSGFWVLIVVIGFIQASYAYPYYYALRLEETSTVSSLFTLGRVLVPVLAYFLIDEQLMPLQYVGFAVVMLCSLTLTYNSRSRLKTNVSFFYMLISAFMIALEVVALKYLFLQGVDWKIAYFWSKIISIGFGILLLVKERKGLNLSFLKMGFGLLAFAEFFNFIAEMLSAKALSIIPATLERTVGSMSPFFVLVLGLHPKFRSMVTESFEKGHILKKILLFLLTIAGVVMAAG